MLKHGKGELTTVGSAARRIAMEKGFAFCGVAGCGKMTMATATGGTRKHECGTADTDEAHAAPKTPAKADGSYKGKLAATMAAARARGARAEESKRRRSTSGGAPSAKKKRREAHTPGSRRSAASGGAPSSEARTPCSSMRRASSIGSGGGGSVLTGVKTASGRAVKRALRYGDDDDDEAATAATTPPPPPPPQPPPPPVEEAPPPPPRPASMAAWAPRALSMFGVLNRGLVADPIGLASLDARAALTNVLNYSWPKARAPLEPRRAAADEDEEAEAVKAADAARCAGPEWAALRFLKKQFIQKATGTLKSNGIIDLMAPGAIAALEAKYNRADEPLDEELLDIWMDADVAADFKADDVKGALARKKRGGGRDHLGWGPDDVKFLVNRAGGCDFLVPLVNAFAQGRFNGCTAEEVELITALRGIPLAKERGNATKARPIGIGTFFKGIAGSLLVSRKKAELRERAGNHQFAVGVSDGTGVAGRILTATLKNGGEGFGVGWSDGENAFGSIHRKNMILALHEVNEMARFARLGYGHNANVSFAQGDTVFTLTQERGGPQGCPLAMPAYCIAQSKALAPMLETIFSTEQEGGDGKVVPACIADDIGIAGEVKDLIRANKMLSETLENETGVRSSALHVYAPNLSVDDRAALIAAGAVIEEQGTVFAGTPIGEDAFIKMWVQSRADDLIKLLAFAEKVAALDGDRGVQLVVHWLRTTIGPTFNHVLRNVVPRLVREQAQRLDDAIANTVLRLTGQAESFAAASDVERMRARTLIQLPIDCGGLGFQSQVMLSDAAYVAGWAAALHTVVGEKSGLGLQLPDAADDAPGFLEDYNLSLEKLRPLLKHELYEKLEWRTIWTDPLMGVQSQVRETLNAHKRKLFVATLPAGGSLNERILRNHALGQNTPEAGAWLTSCLLNPRNQMGNGPFCVAVGKRLLLPVVGVAEGPCIACAGPLDTRGHHASCCPGINKSNRHTIFQNATSVHAREAAQVFEKAPTVATYYAQKPTAEGDNVDDTLSKGDIGLTFKTHQAASLIIVDFTVVAAAKGAPAPYATAGDAAKAAEAAKRKQYAERYDFPPDRFVAFAVEDSGALGPSAKAFQWAIATACGGTANDIARRHRRIVEETSVALQIALYNQHRRFLAACVPPSG
jgi:hypothetical protein